MQNPSVTLNTPSSQSQSQSQTRHQVPLRDYLNTRIAPFLKKALTESLDKEPEYPLQWLGECLINHSILYEGNTEAEKLKEHFRYTFAVPQLPEQHHVPVASSTQSQAPQQTSSSNLEETNGVPPHAQQQGETSTTATTTNGQESSTIDANPSASSTESAGDVDTAATTTTPLHHPPAGTDTEMGGTT